MHLKDIICPNFHLGSRCSGDKVHGGDVAPSRESRDELCESKSLFLCLDFSRRNFRKTPNRNFKEMQPSLGVIWEFRTSWTMMLDSSRESRECCPAWAREGIKVDLQGNSESREKSRKFGSTLFRELCKASVPHQSLRRSVIGSNF